MNSIFTTETNSQTASAGLSMKAKSDAGLCNTSHTEMTDAEREQHIKDCGRLMTNAFERGNRAEAMQWLQAQNEAIRGRSAAQVERMEGCYFLTRGEADRSALEVTNA